jgi:hypothetical protein
MGGVAAGGVAKPLVDEAIDQEHLVAARGFHSFLPCRAAGPGAEAAKNGMNLQVISAPDGIISWVSGALRGSTHDLTAARTWGILRELAVSGLIVPADKGYHGAGEPLITPYRGRNSAAAPAGRPPRQSHPRPANPRNRWLKKVR